MIRLLTIVLIMLLTTATAFAGETYFRTQAGLSFGDMNANAFGVDPDIDTDTGFNINGALGYKAKPGSSFFGEIESGYTDVEGETSVTVYRNNIKIEPMMDFTHVFFNLGYEHVINKRLSASVYAGAGPVWSEIHADITPSRGAPLRLDNIEGDTQLGWQVGGNAWFELVQNFDVGGGVKYVNRGTHRTFPGIEYDYDSVDVTVGARVHF